MDDADVLARISALVDEEHEIYQREGRNSATDADRDRRERLEVTLDQCWDLLHQRRARREAGQDPDGASVRDAKTVEGYVG
ncbi:MAG: DUF2630 family protein [Planctomycetaceae bacterium]